MPRRDWTAAPMMFVPKVLCPHCGSEQHDRSHGEDAGDGSHTQYRVCRDPECGGLFKVVLETPEPGEHVHWPQ